VRLLVGQVNAESDQFAAEGSDGDKAVLACYPADDYFVVVAGAELYGSR